MTEDTHHSASQIIVKDWTKAKALLVEEASFHGHLRPQVANCVRTRNQIPLALPGSWTTSSSRAQESLFRRKVKNWLMWSACLAKSSTEHFYWSVVILWYKAKRREQKILPKKPCRIEGFTCCANQSLLFPKIQPKKLCCANNWRSRLVAPIAFPKSSRTRLFSEVIRSGAPRPCPCSSGARPLLVRIAPCSSHASF